jgi:mannose-1-phosphate guanylyltransferase/mannose-6-phosphate isomerase
LDTFGCVVYADRGTVATLGVSGLVVAKVGDEVLVVPKDRAREVRELVRLLEAP